MFPRHSERNTRNHHSASAGHLPISVPEKIFAPPPYPAVPPGMQIAHPAPYHHSNVRPARFYYPVHAYQTPSYYYPSGQLYRQDN